jgi:hypothetical protein
MALSFLLSRSELEKQIFWRVGVSFARENQIIEKLIFFAKNKTQGYKTIFLFTILAASPFSSLSHN